MARAPESKYLGLLCVWGGADNVFIMGIRQQTFNDFDGFVAKFEPKKTTDDCYTPPLVYEAVKGWACREYEIDPSKVVRPFCPGGDYESYDYSGGKVVIDNPPFSILSKICAFYTDNGIPFFLFAPALTLFTTARRSGVHMIASNCPVTYDNGACVNTSFVTNMGDDLIRTAPDLVKLVNDANRQTLRQLHRQLPKYSYPPELLTVSRLHKIGMLGVEYRVKSSDVAYVSKLDSQRAAGKAVFGGGYLLSDAKAAELKAAELKAAELKAAELKAADDVTMWQLSDRERHIIDNLGQ